MDSEPYHISATVLLQAHPEPLGRWGALALSLLGVLALAGLAGILRAAFFLVTPGQVGLLRARTDFTGQQVAFLHEDQRRLLITFILLQSLAFAGIFLIWADAFANAQPLEAGLWLAGLFLLMALVGVLLPPMLAPALQQTVLQSLSFWVLFAHKVLGPLTVPFRRLAQAMGQGGGAVSMPEDVPDAAQPSPGLNDEGEILRGIARFPTIQVRQVMTSRRDTVGLLVTNTYHEVMDTINKAGYTRYPVYRVSPDTHGPDEVAGILYSKDLLAYTSEGEDFDWQAFLRPVYFAPENKRIDELLRTFQEKKTHVAVVIDEFGGVRGLVTLEDILEEIVGEIQDEFDEEDDQGWRQIDDVTWEFEGRTPLNDLFRATDVDPSAVQAERGSSETVAGLVLEVSQHMPRSGEVVEAGPFRFTVLAASRRQVKRVKVELMGEEE